MDSNETVPVEEETEEDELVGPKIQEEKDAGDSNGITTDNTNSNVPNSEVEKEGDAVIDTDKKIRTN